ncbi:Ear1p PWA37_002015 [Arxiozyma heterogenica]|uniref:Ear1p n=1 Tax=Arxiozyma heterogenica TaxID=278026 RepID=UPI002F208499
MFQRNNRLLIISTVLLIFPKNINALPSPTNQEVEVYVDGTMVDIIQYNEPAQNNKDTKSGSIIKDNDLVYPGLPFDKIEQPQYENESPNVYSILFFIGSIILIIFIANLLLWVIRTIANVLSIYRNNYRLSLYENDMEQQSQGDLLNDTDITETENYDPCFTQMNMTSTTTSDSRIYKKNKKAYKWSVYLDDPGKVVSKLVLLSPEEQFYYHQGEEYLRENPPLLIANNNTYDLRSNIDDPNDHDRERNDGSSDRNDNVFDPVINEQTIQYIEDEGAAAWEFRPDPNLPNDTILVENKTEVIFLNNNYDASIMTTLPIPCINKVYYCEFKIFEWNNQQSNSGDTMDELEDKQVEGLISFGLASSPYPYFRLPGRHHNSIAYDSNGDRRVNTSFPLDESLISIFPKCERGDVIGVGYRTRSGTIFFTRNGKKVNEKDCGGHIRGWKFKYLYPCIGANIPCRIHANFGTFGFVYIEANVKKWGYARITGMKLPPPSYEEYKQDTLIESAGEDDDNEDIYLLNDAHERIHTDKYHNGELRDATGKLLPPPPGFEYSTSPHSINEEISMGYLPSDPPIYDSSLNKIVVNKESNGAIIRESPMRTLIRKLISSTGMNHYSSLNQHKGNYTETSCLQDLDYEYDGMIEQDLGDTHASELDEIENNYVEDDDEDEQDRNNNDYATSIEPQRMMEIEQN